MSLKDLVNRKLIKQRLWNNSESVVEESLIGMAMINTGLIVLKGCQAILRKDYTHMPNKVKIISGGGAGNEPAYAGFVGPGMLTAFISGSIYSSPPSSSILKLIEEVGTNHTPGVLIIIENRPGYRINFTTAALHAENKNLNVKLLLAGKETLSKLNKQSAEDRVQPGILFLLKIAGAMAEEGRSLYEIYTVCGRIAASGEVVSINMGIQSTTEDFNTCTEVEIGSGIHGESGFLKIPFTDLKNTVSVLLNLCLKIDSIKYSKCFTTGHKIAVIVNNTGGCSQLETNIFAMEIIHQLSDLKFVVERSYVGTLISVLDHRGFHVSLVDLSFDSLLQYLDQPVKAPAWPSPLSIMDLQNNCEFSEKITTSGRYIKDNEDDLQVQLLGPSVNERSAQAFLTAVSFACDAVIACEEQINVMDAENGDGDCGTTLAKGAKAIKAAIKQRQILGINPYMTFTQIGKILEQKMGGLQGGLYSLFFQTIAKVFSLHSKTERINVQLWLKAFTAANKTVSEFAGINEGDRTLLDPLLSAQKKLECALNRNCHPIQAFREAVRDAEENAIKTTKMPGQTHLMDKKFIFPDPGAHAVGIWLRAAYEGIKLKFVCECETTN